MNNRKAFTLIELLVVIGIIAILAGILLPAVVHMQRSARITGQKADFVTISNALEQYKADFGDYPRNTQLPRWNTQTGNVPAPVYLSLAAALLGPGPGGTQPANGNLEYGDGADGMGFRTQATNVVPLAVGTVAITGGQINLTFTVDPAYTPQFNALMANTTATIIVTFPPTPAQPVGESLAIQPGTLANGMATTSAPAFYTHSGASATLFIPGGKVWGPYLQADTFKVAFVPAADVNGTALGGFSMTASPGYNASGGYGQPVLLDRWGQVVQYFPRYGLANNRMGDSVDPLPAGATALTQIQAGPLYGNSQPKSIDTTNGENAIWDNRDGTPFYTAIPNTGNAAFCQQWQRVTSPSNNTPYYFRPDWTFEWMLGGQLDPPTNPTTIDDAVYTGATIQSKLSYDGPFILISAGPDGPDRANGGFCNFANPTTGTLTDANGAPLTAGELQQIFVSSGNIYNFDRP